MYRNTGKIKVMAVYGDSISHPPDGYVQMMAQWLRVEKLHNYAICASGLSTRTPDNLTNILQNDDKVHPEADLIILWHGSNDWYWGSPMGDYGNGDTSTYLGALENAVSVLRRASLHGNIIVPTPIFRFQAPHLIERKAGDAFFIKNSVGLTMKDYHYAVLQSAPLLGFSTLDMRALTGFSNITEQFFLPDLLHPSVVGRKRIAEILCAHVDQLSFTNS